ncbi:hypothetical protein L6R53_31945 [Myxococcota bacterium]|nr:hypothetical protein [Myxococcota bacterium]
MNTAAAARALRERVLPDALLSHLPARTQNGSLRRGLWGVRVADRAAALLTDVCPPDLAGFVPELQAIAYLTGLLDLDTEHGPMTPALLQSEGFSDLVCLGVLVVQGRVFETPHGYWTQLRGFFYHFRLVRGALAVAEVEDVAPLPAADPRRRKVLGDAWHWVLPILVAGHRPLRTMGARLIEALALAAFEPGGLVPAGPIVAAYLGAALGPDWHVEGVESGVVIERDGEACGEVRFSPPRLRVEAVIHVCGPSEIEPSADTLAQARCAMVELVGAWLLEAGFELEGEGEACVAWLASDPALKIHTWRAQAARSLGSLEEAVEAVRAQRPSAWSFDLGELVEHWG